jgi:hypothetical protein
MTRFLILVSLLPVSAFTQCISISDAAQHIGRKTCIAAKVMRVTETENGSFQLDFCAEAKCPFIVRVFPTDFDYVGDVRELAGKKIEISGKIRERNGQSEIVLRDSDQLRGTSANIPPIPKTYDVERRGNFSPGQFKGNRTSKRSHKRPPSEPSQEIDTE